MSYTKKKFLDCVLAMVLTVMMVIAMMPMNVFALENAQYATVTTLTGGEVKNNGTANVEVVIEEATLQWVAGNSTRSEGWWVGIKVEAPEGYSADATYKRKSNPSHEYGEAVKFADAKDGENYIELWFAVSPESLVKFANEGRNLTMMYAFDWNADTNYGQEITFTLVPSGDIVLMKGEEQSYPFADNYGSITTFTGGNINNNGTANVEVVVEETTLTWVEGNSTRAEGWWVGIKAVAPEGFSANATYKSKSNPANVYGSATKFSDAKDGDNYIELWFAVSPESLVKFANENRNLTMMYAFDWNADAVYEQEVTFSVVPSEKIVLMKEGEQVYPVITYDVTVEKNDGGAVKVNGAENATTAVDRNSNVTISVTANEGYQIASVKIAGEEMTVPAAATEYSKTIESIKKDSKIEVVFVKVYTATVTHDGNGTGVSNPANGGSVIVESGQTIDITATPDAGNRVVSVTINGDEDTTVTGANNGGYTNTLTADKDYTVVITFAPNVYKIETSTTNGSATPASTSVEHGGNTVVTLSPNQGYTVDTVTVNSTPVEAIVKDSTGVHFVIENITEDQNVIVTYKNISTATKGELTIDSSAALRDNDEDTFFVIQKGSSIVFKTEKAGIKVYNADGVIGGSETTQSVAVDANTVVTKIELYYTDSSEYYDELHEVVMDDVKIVIDEGDNVTASLVPTPSANTNGYHNSNVTFTVNAEDTGDYSGLELVEYWITYNGTKGEAKELYKHDTEIKNIFTDDEKVVVDASLYNSADVKVTLHVVDRAGNEKTVDKTLKINSTKPTLSLDITGTKFDNAQDGYYNDKRELTITIVDRADTFSKANVAAGLVVKKNGQVVTVNTDDIEWTTDTDNLHIGKYVFESDGHYEWSISYENLAGLKNDGVTAPSDKFIYDFYVDKIAPYDLKVTYEPTFTDVVLETITFGFYKAPVKVTIEAVDDTAEIAQFEYKYTGVNSTVVSGADVKRDGTRAYAEFTIPAEFRGSVSFSATDRSGRSTELSDERVVVIDTIAPGITVEWEPNAAAASNGKYFNTDRTATIKIEEANFFAADIEDGLLVITQTMTLDDGTFSETILKPKFKAEDGKYVATVKFDQNADYTFDIKYTDRSGNVYDEYPMDEFTIDKINPVISVSFDNNTAVNGDQFKAARKATITVIEHNFFADDMVVTVNGSEYVVTWTPVTGEVDTYTAEIPFPGDAHYTFSVEGKDYAANNNDTVIYAQGTVAPEKFTVDASGPENLTITYEPTFVGTLLEGLTFGFYQAPVKVTIEATDDIAGIDYFTYSYIVQDGASTVNVGKKDVVVDVEGMKTTASTTFEIPAQFRGFVSFKATNNADVSSSQADPNVVVVDDIAPGITVTYTNNSVQNDSYYKADRTATIRIEEANFFAADIEDGLLVITRKTVLNDGTVKEETLTPVFAKEENSDVYTATIDFDQNADYTFDIKYTDRSGNTYDSYEMDKFTVDKIKPVISIEKANGAYFNADRTAKITVVEHNFRASDFDFDAEAYDVTGKIKIDLASKDYKNCLKNQDKWTEVAPDTWEAVITFDIEGNYKVSATYSDLAGNEQVEAISDTFCVDKTDPANLKISYEPTFVGVLLEGLTFGFYKAPVKVTIEATDDIAGVDHFVYSYAVQEGASTTNIGKLNQTATATRDGNTNRWYTSFEIPAQFRGFVSFTAYDKATNDAYLADANAVVVDNVAPGINVEYNNKSNYDKWFYKADRTATITITEANFFAQDIEDGLLVITVEKTLNDGIYTSTKMSPTFAKNGDVYTATIPFTEDADYTFDIKYTDRSGNVYDSYEKDIFTVDKTAPVIDVTYDNNNAKNNDQFKANRVATIKVTEHNFRADYVVAKVMASGTEVTSYAEYLKDDANWKHYTLDGVEVDAPEKGDVHIAKITYSKEAHYTFEISCTDKAGNISGDVNYGNSVAPTAFTLDKSAPTDMQINIADKSVKGSMSTHTFDTFYGATVTVKLSANCDISGLESLKYQKVADVSEYKVDGTWVDYNAQTGIVVEPSEKFVIYFRAEDRAGNVEIIRSTGIVVDDKKPEGETNAPEIDILPAAPNANGLHKDDVSVDLKVVDPKYAGATAADNGHYSGLNKITYKIYTTDTDAVEEGTLLDLASKTEGAVFDADKLVSSWSGKITIDSEKFNSNNVIVEVIAVDNAGNERKTTTKAGDIQIDITAPTIVVSYDNNSADSETFFKEDRTATVVITERNFNAKDVVVTITNTDGVVPTISDFTKNAGNGNGDDTTWTATIKYTADGDYEFDIAYTDLAENACAGETFAEGTVAPKAFTIDHTAPVIAVTYDNNEALNSNYYKAVRIATVVITEHNFNAERVTITHTATDNGAETTKPIISGWTSDGDKHTATISYSKDAKYTFDIAMNDKAGNVSADYTEETFYVDLTNPAVSISKIVDQSANNDEGNIGFVVTATDTNFDVFTPVLTVTDIKGGSTNLNVGATTDIANGKTYTVENLDADGIYRITCTVVDKAGNAYSEVTLQRADGSTYVEKRAGEDTLVTFSVNRDGSTYEINENTASLIEKYYVQNVTDNVVIVETNADVLNEYKVTLNGKELAKDTDYTVAESGGNGQWMKYTYTVNKTLFADEGEYKLVVSSKDKAENDAFSDVKDTTINFVVDRTAPIVTITGMAKDGRYQTESQKVTLVPTDDGGALKTLIVRLVDEDGKVIGEPIIDLAGEALEKALEDGAGKIEFTIAEGMYQNIQIICNDCAVDEDGKTNTYDETITNVTVTPNGFMIFWANKPLRWGSIAGVILLTAAIIFFIFFKKRKKEEQK